MKAVSFELIQQRAYEIWEREGALHGRDKEHWELAERELLDAAPNIDEKAPRVVQTLKASNPLDEGHRLPPRVSGTTANPSESVRAR